MTGRSPRRARYDGRESNVARKSQRDAWCSTNCVLRLPPWHPPALQARRQKARRCVVAKQMVSFTSRSRWSPSSASRTSSKRSRDWSGLNDHANPTRQIGGNIFRESQQWCTDRRRHGHEPRFPPLQDGRLRPLLKRDGPPWQASPQHVERA